MIAHKISFGKGRRLTFRQSKGKIEMGILNFVLLQAMGE